jgi:hypothetical protein
MTWLASTQAATQAVQAVELLYNAAGASAVYTNAGFERCLRDVTAAAQHIVVTPTNFEIAGQLALGMDVRQSELPRGIRLWSNHRDLSLS